MLFVRPAVVAPWIVLLQGCAALQSGDDCPAHPAQDALAEINRARAADGAPAVRVDLRLVQAARAHAAELARGEASGHVGANGSDPASRASRATYPYQRVGEDVASGFDDAGRVVAAWMTSARHRAVLLDRRYRDVGIGTAVDADGRAWVALFGKAGELPERPRLVCHPPP